MKIFYFLLLSTTIFCLNNEQLNSTKFQKTKKQVISNIRKKFLSFSTMPSNYRQYVQNFTFSGNVFVDIIPHDSVANKILEFGLPENKQLYKEMLFTLEFIPFESGTSFDPGEIFNATSGVLSLYQLHFYNLTIDESISYLYITKAKTTANKKQLYGTYRIKECKRFLFFKDCHYRYETRKREYTAAENKIVEKAALAYTYSELIKKLDLIK